MKILLSPAKSIDFSNKHSSKVSSLPTFLSESEYLINKLKKLNVKKIQKLMGVSSEIANLNYNRFQEWSLPFNEVNSRSAADIFTGAAYQGLDFLSLSEADRSYGQESLRILSGLYGVLKPLDLIQPYRLEMGTRFAVTPKNKNLYLFWGDKLCDNLNLELSNDPNEVLVNCASSEYFKAAKLNNIKSKVITPIFKDKSKNGEYKVIMTFAKKARGLMTRYIIQNRISKIEDLKGFNLEGYSFVANESNDNEIVFLRG